MFILVVVLIGVVGVFMAYGRYDVNRRADQFESLFKDIMEKLMEMGEDLYDIWEDGVFRTGEVKSRPSDGGLSQIRMFLNHGYKDFHLHICFKDDLPGADTVRKLYRTNMTLLLGNSTLVEIIGKCCVHELSAKQIAQQIHAAAELFRKSYPEIRIAKEKIEAAGNFTDPGSIKTELDKQAQRIVLKNFLAQFKKKKLFC